jgi:hypothetical protein
VEAEIRLDRELPPNLVLWDQADGKAIPVQAWRGEGTVKLAWIVEWMARGESRSYALCLRDEPSDLVAGVCLQEGPGKVKVSIGGRHLTTYNCGPDVVRPYLYPVYADEGVGVTRDWPMVQGAEDESIDHPHHKGIYTAQDEIREVNNWGEGEGHGWQIHKQFSRIYSGPVAGGFTSEIDWTDQDRSAYMTETRHITFYNTSLRARLLDYQVTFHASHGDLVIGDTKEGGFISVRVAPSMEEERGGGTIVNGCGGASEAETWGKRAHWCDYSGRIGDELYGVAVLDHPLNPRFPTYWHVRAYGLMTANPVGRHHFSGDGSNRWDLPIAAGESKSWRYRVLVHHGNARAAGVPIHYEGFAYPPTVDVVALG